MKKIKLFALAIFAMLSTNAFAQLSSGLFNIQSLGGDNVKIISFANDVTAAQVKDLVIPATLTNTGGNPYKVVEIEALTANATLLKAIETVVIEDENVAAIDASAFYGATSLKSVTIGKAVATIGEKAFYGCTSLATVNFTAASELAAIGNYAFGGTPALTSISFANCPKMINFTTTPFNTSTAALYTAEEAITYNASLTGHKASGDDVPTDYEAKVGSAAAGTTLTEAEANAYNATLAGAKKAGDVKEGVEAPAANNYLTSVVLNGNTTNIGVAFAKVPNLATLELKNTKLLDLKALALDGNTKITTLELPASCVSVKNTALQGTVVSTLTINSNQAGTTQTIGEGGGAVYGTTVNKLTNLTFDGEFKGTIEDGAFAGMTALTTVTFGNISGKIEAAAIGSKVTSLTIGNITGAADIATGAIVLDPANSSTVEIGDLAPTTAAKLATGAITGPTTSTKTAALTVGDITKSIAGLISNNVGAATVGIIGDGETVVAVPVAAFGNPTSLTFGEIKASASLGAGPTTATYTTIALTSLTFNGAIAGSVGAGAFSYATLLKTVTLSGLAVDGAFAAASFYNATGPVYAGSAVEVPAGETIKMTVTYSPAGIAAANDAPFNVQAFAATGYDGAINVKLSTTAAVQTAEAGLERVKFGIPPTTQKITLAKKDGDWYYGKFYNADGRFEISKEDAIVYSAYVDASDATIYMDQLRIVNGVYVVAQGEPVVVKSKTNTEVTATGTDANHTMRTVSGEATIINDINWTNSVAAYTLIDANPGKDVWAMAKPESYNLTWKKFKATVTLPNNTFYIITTPVPAGGRLNVVWLDGSEDNATAIQGVKNVVEDGAIYNLAGQKVSASYKGVVIKNGKKFIQK